MKYSPPHFLTYVNRTEAQKLHFSTFTHRGQAHTDGMIINTNTETRKKEQPQKVRHCATPLSATSTLTHRRIGRSPVKGQDFLRHLRPSRRHGERTRYAPLPHLIYIYPSIAHIRAGRHHLHANRGYRLHRAHIFRSVVVQGKIFFVLLRCK